MTSANKKKSNSEVLLIAIEVSDKKWGLGFSRGGKKIRRRCVDAWDQVRFSLEVYDAKQRLGLDHDCIMLSCYEAGRVGFSLHRFLEAKGIHNEILESSSIEVNRKAKRAKTDQLDLTKMLAMMVRKHIHHERDVYHTVSVPSREQEAALRLHRERGRLQKERTAHCARIRSLLALHGVKLASLKGLDPATDSEVEYS